MTAIHWDTLSSAAAAETIAKRIDELLLGNESVLWLVSGGSNIAIEREVLRKITFPLGNLTIALVDERFGKPGHKDSNWQKLLDADFFIQGPVYVPALIEEASTLDEATAWYNFTLEKLISLHEYVFAQLGIGVDGHIAGILPESSATKSTRYVHGYVAKDFDRLTATFMALKCVDEVALVAYGHSKQRQLERLKDPSITPFVQPMQIIKDIRSVNIYTDS